jgi:ABC-type Fe3+/spermidine/putrescine transport system ATPase subunit
MKPETEYVATFLGAANLLVGVIRGGRFEAEGVSIDLEEDASKFKEGQAAKLVFRPEDIFLRKPENLSQHYQALGNGTVEEVSFVGAFERLVVRLKIGRGQTVIVTRPKTETTIFPLEAGHQVTAGIVRFRVLASFPLVSERAGAVV